MNGYTYGDNNPVMMVIRMDIGHIAFGVRRRCRIIIIGQHMHMLRELSLLVAVRDSYAGFVGMGNGLNKAFTLVSAGLLDGKHLKITQKENCKLISWTACCKTANHKNTVKSAAKGAFLLVVKLLEE